MCAMYYVLVYVKSGFQTIVLLSIVIDGRGQGINLSTQYSIFLITLGYTLDIYGTRSILITIPGTTASSRDSEVSPSPS